MKCHSPQNISGACPQNRVLKQLETWFKTTSGSVQLLRVNPSLEIPDRCDNLLSLCTFKPCVHSLQTRCLPTLSSEQLCWRFAALERVQINLFKPVWDLWAPGNLDYARRAVRYEAMWCFFGCFFFYSPRLLQLLKLQKCFEDSVVLKLHLTFNQHVGGGDKDWILLLGVKQHQREECMSKYKLSCVNQH